MKSSRTAEREGVWILGANSSIARAIAKELARRGHPLVLGGRDVAELDRSARDTALRFGVDAVAQNFDALDYASHPAAVEKAEQALGGKVGGVVLCFGYLGEQDVAEIDFAEAGRIIDTNFTAAVSVLNILATRMEARAGGFICVLSSVAGDRGRQSNYIYGAAKGGLSLYAQGLRNRLYAAGVRVITVKPGFTDTGMTYGRGGMFLVAQPEAIARGVVAAIQRGPDIVYLPRFWWGVMAIIRSLPERVFKRMKL